MVDIVPIQKITGCGLLCRKLNSNWKAEKVRDCFRNRKIKENGGDKDGYIENPGGR